MKQLLALLALSIGLDGDAQNVGIGTSTPTEKLTVNGNIKSDTIKPSAIKFPSQAGEGKVLTSDAAGNATWRSADNAAAAGNIGFGTWGDCNISGIISNYQPMADSAGGGDNLGYSVAMSGNFAIAGLKGDDIAGKLSQGSASIYEFDGEQWIFRQRLLDPAGEAGDEFGTSVSISGNFAIIGARYDDVGADLRQGSACIFRYNGSSWVFMQKLTDGTGVDNDFFGTSVAISGTHAAVGCPEDIWNGLVAAGTVSTYTFNGTSWIFKAKLNSNIGDPGERFGSSVAISGDHLLTGAPFGDNMSTADAGAAYFFEYNGTSWVFVRRLFGLNVNGHLGEAVALSGNYAVVGAPGALVGGVARGHATVYDYSGNDWGQADQLTDLVASAGDSFGTGVAISGDYIVVGADLAGTTNYTAQGEATLYRLVGDAWRRITKFDDPNGEAADNFGTSVAVDGTGKRFAIGAPQTSGNGQRGIVYFGKIN